MATLYLLKPAFQKRLGPLVRRLAARGITANQVTLTAVVLSTISGASIALWPGAALPLLLMPFVLLGRLALNAVDGMLARDHGQSTRLGVLLNELGDVLSDAGLFLPMALVPGLSAEPVVIAVVLAATSEMSGALALAIGSSRRYDGPMGKSDRAFAFGALALWLGLGLPAGFWIDGYLWTVVILLLATIWNRARGALREAPR